MSDSLYSIRAQIRNRKRNAEIEADDLARAYRAAGHSASRYRAMLMDDNHSHSMSSVQNPVHSSPLPPPPSQGTPLSDHRQPPKKAKFMFIGDFFDCDEQMEAFVKSQDYKQQTGVSRPPMISSPNDVEDEIASLIYENNDLQSKLKNITNEYESTRNTLNEKVTLINTLQVEINRLKEECNSLRGGNPYPITPVIENSTEMNGADQIYNVISQNNIDTLSTQQNEIKSLLLEIKTKLDGESYAVACTSNIRIPGAEEDTVLLPPLHNLSVNRDRYSHARSSPSATAYVQKLLTALFSFDELIAATLSGSAHPNSEKGKKIRQEMGENSTEPLKKVKSLDNKKVSELIESAQYFYPNNSSSLQECRKSIGWKLSKLNIGNCTKNDKIAWQGFNEAVFQSLVPKKTQQEGEADSMN